MRMARRRFFPSTEDPCLAQCVFGFGCLNFHMTLEIELLVLALLLLGFALIPSGILLHRAHSAGGSLSGT